MITFFTAWTYKTHKLVKTYYTCWKKIIIYRCPPFPQLGGAIIEESAFWLTTQSHIQKPYIHTFFFPKYAKYCNPTLSDSSQEISPISTKLCTQHLWTPWKKVIKRILIFQAIIKLLNNNFLYILLKTQSVAYLHTQHFCLNDLKPRWLLPHEPLRLWEKNDKLFQGHLTDFKQTLQEASLDKTSKLSPVSHLVNHRQFNFSY